jgi:uncharacterized membrane-anchored protein
VQASSFSRALARPGALRVPQITVLFWVVKALSTALGESTSDYLVHAINPFVAVALGFVAFVAALLLQFSRRRYRAWNYWVAVAAVGVFGTMAADALHVGAGVPYPVTTGLYAAVLVGVFVVWQRVEGTLSIHRIDTARREMFYWLAVCATFAMGTALGDLTAATFHLGYLTSGIVFACVIAVPAAGYRWFGWNPVLSFWLAYVMTRPLGASFADYMGKPTSVSGLGWGDGPVAAVLAIAMFCLVAYLAVSRRDVQQADERRLVGRSSGSTPRRGATLEDRPRGPAGATRSGTPAPQQRLVSRSPAPRPAVRIVPPPNQDPDAWRRP